MFYRRREPSLRSRGLIAILAVAFSGAAMAQTANPFAFLFGGPPPWEGRSAYGPGAVYPPSPYREYHPGGYSSPPDYYDPYEYEPPRVYRQRRPPVEVDRRGPDAPSPQEVMTERGKRAPHKPSAALTAALAQIAALQLENLTIGDLKEKSLLLGTM